MSSNDVFEEEPPLDPQNLTKVASATQSLSTSGSSPVSPGLQPSLPCVVDGSIAIQIERHASVREKSLDHDELCDRAATDSGVDEDAIIPDSYRRLFRQPIYEELVKPANLQPPADGRKYSIDHDQSSQESTSPLHSPRDTAGSDVTDTMSPFHAFLHSKVCAGYQSSTILVEDVFMGHR